jgi:hypothetical protein
VGRGGELPPLHIDWPAASRCLFRGRGRR